MKVYMVTNWYQGCGYVRLFLPAYQNGYILNREELGGEIADAETARTDMLNSDVIVFHRPEEKKYLELAKMLKADGKKIVMDNDDTFNLEDNHPLADLTATAEKVQLKSRNDAINNFLEIADLVTTTTKTLAEEYSKRNDNVIILPNCIDPFDWEEPLRNEGAKVRIGLVGSVAFEYDYQHIKDIIRKLSERDDVEIVMFGLTDMEHRKANPNVTEIFKDDYAFWDTIKKEHFAWCKIEDYPRMLNEARLDMMLIPRKDNYFNRCKSNVKFLEASMCEIPVIAQSFPDGPYEEIENWNNGVLIGDNNDWKKAIDRLINDKMLRRLIGKSAKQYTLNNYNIENKSKLWQKAYEQLYEN